MATQQPSTVVGVFEDRVNADRAVGQLLMAGFREDQIGVALRHADDTSMWGTTPDADDSHTHAEAGAIAGA